MFLIITLFLSIETSLVAQMVKHLPTMRETRVQSLGREDLLEKEIATLSSILAWKIPWTAEPGGLQSMGSQRVGHDWMTSPSPSFLSIGFIVGGMISKLLVVSAMSILVFHLLGEFSPVLILQKHFGRSEKMICLRNCEPHAMLILILLPNHLIQLCR